MNFSESERLQQLSNEYILGGVNSPSRSYKAVGGGAPVVMKEGHGAYLYDVDGNKFIDYLQAYGQLLRGMHILILLKQFKNKQPKVFIWYTD